MAPSPDEMAASMIANLKDKTGKTLEQWLKITRTSGLAKHGEIVKHLKGNHGVTHGFANLIAHKTLAGDSDAPSGDDLIAAQYAGGKEGLRPIYERIVLQLARFGDDIEISPKKTYVSLRRHKQFALIQPSTKTRVDVGLNLPSVKPTKRLEASGSFNTMVSHRVRLTDADQVDSQLIGWLREAYEGA